MSSHSHRTLSLRRSCVRAGRLIRAGALALLGTCLAQAQTDRTYTAGANGTWNTNSNWSGNNAPNASNERAVFGNATGRTVTFNTNATVGGILFNGTAGAYTISNTTGTRTLTIGSYGITNNSSSDQLITGSGLRLTLGAATAFTVNGSGDLIISTTGGNLSTSSSRALTLNGTGSGMGLITSTINGAGSVNKSGSGEWTLSGINAYTGNTNLLAGTLYAGSNSAFGTGNIVLDGGTLAASGSTRTLANTVRLDGNSTIGGSVNIVLNGAMTNTETSATSVTLTVSNSGTTTLGALALSSDATNRTVNTNVTGTGNVTISGVISNGGTSTASSFIKSGVGNLTFGGTAANTYSGLTTVAGGTLLLGKTAGVNAIAGNVVIGDGSGTDTLRLTAANQIADTAAITFAAGGTPVLDLNGFSETIGSISSTNANASILLGTPGSATTFAVGDATNTSYAGTISGGANAGLLKQGAGTLTLTNANSSFAGLVTIANGTLSIASLANAGSNSALGQNATIALGNGTSTGTLQYTGGATTSNRSLTLAGTTGGGTLDTTGNTGALVLSGGVSASVAGAKTLTLTGTSTHANALSGAIANGSGTVSLLKSGTGNWTLSGSDSNTYTGTTTVAGGTLILAKSASATAVAGSIVIGDGSGTDTLQLGASHQIADNASVTLAAGGTPIFNLNGYSERIGLLASTNSAAVVQFGTPASATTFTVGNVSSSTYAGTFASGNANTTLVKEGLGTLTLTGASTSYTGAVAINAGAIRVQSDNALGVGTAGTTVANGASLILDGGRLNTSNGELTIAGAGFGPVAALVGSNGNNRWNGNITLTDNTTFSTSGTGYLALGITTTAYNRELDPPAPPSDPTRLNLGGSTLTLTGSTSAADNRAIYVNSRITGSGNVVVDMVNASDTVRYTANFNDYTGTTTIKNGTLSLRTLANTYPNDPVDLNYFGINGPVVIGDGLGSAGSARLLIEEGPLYGEQINFNSQVSIFKDGLFDLRNNQTIGGLTFTGGAVDLGTTGVLFLNGDVTVNASAGNTATISGTGTSSLSLTTHQGPIPVPNAERTFNVVGGVGNTSDLTISAVINYGSIKKEGAGTMTITSGNAGGYEGTTTINNGILSIQNSTALGQADGQSGTGTLVNSGGTLQLSNVANGNLTVSGEKLTLNGSGYNGNGALQNLAGNNTWGGSAGIVLGSDATIKSDANTLTIATAITSSSSTLTVTGAGNTTITGAIGTNSGGLVKEGTGTLVLAGNNNYNGGTSVNAGVVSVQSNTALGTTSGGTTVAAGAAVQLDNTAIGGGANQLTVIGEPITINGTGVGGTGAFRNVSGNNTFQGVVNVASSSLITSNSGNTLNLAGGFTSSAGSGQTVTFGTTAQNGNVRISGNITAGSLGLTKAGSGNLLFGSTTSALTGTVGQVQLNAGSMTVGSGTHATTLNTGAISSLAGTTLTIASGGTVKANYASGTTVFSGALAGSGNFQKDGAGTLVFNNSFNASNLTLTLNGGTLSLLGGGYTFNTIHITGDTVLDFNNSAGTFLSSANLIIDAGVTVTVTNWVSVTNNPSASTAWYVTNPTNGVQGSTGNLTLTGGTVTGNTPLNQIVFDNYNGMTTTWVSGNTNGWFDREIRPTPEPATYGAMFVSGCLGLLGWRRYRHRRRAAA